MIVKRVNFLKVKLNNNKIRILIQQKNNKKKRLFYKKEKCNRILMMK
jgi:hypothetical protein